MPDHLIRYIRNWNLREDGDPFITSSGWLQPVLYNEIKCMLKIARRDKDRRANEVMIWWKGDGAANVFLHDNTALLMERAIAVSSLVEMSKNELDDEATRILCGVVGRLHCHRPPYPENLVPLTSWFKELPLASAKYGGLFTECRSIADSLLDSQQDVVVLHGDIHHGNVLDFGDRGWLAIDPKGLVGERGFDYANIFCNPDAATATQPGRLMEQAAIVADAAGLDQIRLLRWIASWAGLSASWCINDKEDPQQAMSVAKLAVVGLQALTVL
jgi:streptomycin 6-kinase